MEKHPQGLFVAKTALLTLLVFAMSTSMTENGRVRATESLNDGLRTGTAGSVLRSDSSTRPAGSGESSSTDSTELSEVALVPCSAEELFAAAASDDVASIIRCRELGGSLDITRSVDYGKFGYQSFTLTEYAAICGSFRIVEDLLVNGDFRCEDQASVDERICRLSDDEKCRPEDEGRKAIASLADLLFTDRCGENRFDLEEKTGPDGKPIEKVLQMSGSSMSAGIPCGEYNYFVSVRKSFDDAYQHVCGGVLISEEFALTAAHCVDGTKGYFNPVLVLNARDLDLEKVFCDAEPEIRKAAKVEIHPNWLEGDDAGTFGNGYDVAVIKLSTPSTKNAVNIQAAEEAESGDSVKSIGLGRQSEKSGLAAVTQVAVSHVIDKETCQNDYDREFHENILCTGGESEYCEGDDGGPLISTASGRDELVGLAHLKDPSDICGTSDYPGLYIDLTKLSGWIEETQKNM